MGVAREETIANLELRLQAVEQRFGNMNYDMRGVVQSELNDRMVVHQQAETQFGLYTGLCIDTLDVWKQNRVRFFCPAYHDPKTPIKSLPWAFPVSAMGGFDDCGMNWIPPAGSTICILFEAGQRSSPYYIGTTWHRNRGPEGQNNFGFNIDEYYKISAGHRKGYLVGSNDESQVFPPWNTESYNGFDLSSVVDFADNPEAQKRMTHPNIYGFKTPEKHMWKGVDGDPNCNRRFKRIEMSSGGGGGYLCFKDDHLHGAQWAHPSCGGVDGDISCISGQGQGSILEDITRFQGLNSTEIGNTDFSLGGGTKSEDTSCGANIIGGHPSTGHPNTKYFENQVGANPYFKHENECRPYRGPGTPQNNKFDLPQSGIQLLSRSGITFVMDDSVEEPQGVPNWEQSLEDFDFGCSNKFLGRTYWKSATGHSIEMSDVEEESQLRGPDNYIRLMSAGGNKIELNDHTIAQKDCPGCPPNVAGDKRGIFLGSTSGHTIEMMDESNEQCSPCRKENGYDPISKAKKGFVKIRTGYGITIDMQDTDSQEDTVQQSFQITCPQKDNTDRGPHILRMQESPTEPGLIFLRAGGNYVVSTYDDMVEIVGDVDKNPADKLEIISKKKLVYTKDTYINVTDKSHLFIAKEKIMLMAGNDCPSIDGTCGPCLGPVLVYVGGCIRLSDKVYASASLGSPAASIFMMSPLIECPLDPGSCKE